MIKVILTYLLLGLFLVSFIAAYIPEELIGVFLTGCIGIIIGAAIGEPLYTSTLVEIILTKLLLDL